MSIHLIEKLNNFVRLQDNTWESGWWNLDEGKARKLVGDEIYFHRRQQEPSFYGGTIIGYRIEQDGQYQGKIIFKLQHNKGCRNVKTDKHGWSRGIKIVDHE